MRNDAAASSGTLRRSRHLLLTYGFRPFFLFAGLIASLAMLAWLLVWFGYAGVATPFSPVIWHGHEMLFGYGMAVIAGFLLTASPNWLGSKPFAGTGLLLLALLWLLGRVAYWSAAALPLPLVAAVDLGFVVALGLVVAVPLVQAKARRQYPLIGVLAVLLVANLMTYLEGFGLAVDPRNGLVLGVDVIVLLIGLMGGRIIPSFTGNALRAAGNPAPLRAWPWLERLTLPTLALFVITDVVLPGSLLAALAAFAAAAVHGFRLSGWQTRQVLRQPILWVLHAGYAWLAVGLGLRGLADIAPAVPASAALHALTAGAIGVMTLGVMSRVALGHTGRALVVAWPVAAAYGLVNLAALLRVFVPILAPNWQAQAIAAAGACWIVGFLLFSVVYWPILTRPRADSRPG